MGVIMMSLRSPQSAGENIECTWVRLGAATRSLGAPTTSLGAATSSLGAATACLGALMKKLGAPMTSMGAHRINVEQSGECIFFGNAARARGNHSYSDHSTICKTLFFSLYSHVYSWIATYLHMADWLRAVLESNSSCACK
jgi:hypothetical protein